MNHNPFPADFPFHTMEVYMLVHREIDFSSIDVHIQRARLARSAALGTAIADGVLAAWVAHKRVGRYLSTRAEQLTRSPDSYSTSLRRP